MSSISLRPLEFGEILDAAIELYRRNFATFLGIYAVAAAPYVAISTPLSVKLLEVSPDPSGLDFSRLGLPLLAATLAFLIYTTVLSPMISGALTIAVSERFLGRDASLGSAYRRVLKRLRPLLGSLLLVTIPLLGAVLATVVGAVLVAVLLALWLGWDLARITAVSTVLCVPLVSLVVLLFLVWFGFVPAAVVLEGRGLDSLQRSIQLVRGRFKRVFGLFCVLFAMVVTMAAYLRLPSQLLAGTAGLGGELSTALLGGLAMQLGILLVDPVRMVGITLIYYDLRIRNEGFDLSLLADELGAADRKGGTP